MPAPPWRASLCSSNSKRLSPLPGCTSMLCPNRFCTFSIPLRPILACESQNCEFCLAIFGAYCGSIRAASLTKSDSKSGMISNTSPICTPWYCTGVPTLTPNVPSAVSVIFSP
ncbi:Uncharacterised protein [Vibrio cholerae]|nr:Uncharacterised protein [Vibrio cholerae]